MENRMFDIIYDGPAHLTFSGTTDTVFAVIANVMLVALYVLSPLPTLLRILKKESTEKFHPYPYMISLLHCSVCIVYVMPYELEPLPFNIYCLCVSHHIGMCFAAIYFLWFFLLTTTRNMLIMCTSFPIVIGMFGTIGYFWYSWGKIYGDTKSTCMMVHLRLVMPMCVASGITLYASPLSIIKNVYETKSVEYLPVWRCIACFLNGLVWVVYACVSPTVDPCIVLTNGVGMLLGIFQLLLFHKFTRSSNTVHVEGFEDLGDQIAKTICNNGVTFSYLFSEFVGKTSYVLQKRYLIVFAVILGIFIRCWFQEEAENIYSMPPI